VRIPQNAIITMLGSDLTLPWVSIGKNILIEIPESLQKKPPCKFAWSFKISVLED